MDENYEIGRLIQAISRGDKSAISKIHHAVSSAAADSDFVPDDVYLGVDPAQIPIFGDRLCGSGVFLADLRSALDCDV